MARAGQELQAVQGTEGARGMFTCEQSKVEIEAGGGEGPVTGVAICGLKVAGSGKGAGVRVPEATAEVSDQRQRRPQRRDLGHERRVLRHAPQRVVQGAPPPLDSPSRLVDAERRLFGRGLRLRRRRCHGIYRQIGRAHV